MMATPMELTHVAFYTNALSEMSRWYEILLDGHTVVKGDNYAFISDESDHHRIALIGVPEQARRRLPTEAGFYHGAFRLASLKDMKFVVDRLANAGIVPYRVTNHAVTLSMYLHDPDGNSVELYADLFAMPNDAKAYMNTEEFAADPSGRSMTFEDLRALLWQSDDEDGLRRSVADYSRS